MISSCTAWVRFLSKASFVLTNQPSKSESTVSMRFRPHNFRIWLSKALKLCVLSVQGVLREQTGWVRFLRRSSHKLTNPPSPSVSICSHSSGAHNLRYRYLKALKLCVPSVQGVLREQSGWVRFLRSSSYKLCNQPSPSVSNCSNSSGAHNLSCRYLKALKLCCPSVQCVLRQQTGWVRFLRSSSYKLPNPPSPSVSICSHSFGAHNLRCKYLNALKLCVLSVQGVLREQTGWVRFLRRSSYKLRNPPSPSVSICSNSSGAHNLRFRYLKALKLWVLSVQGILREQNGWVRFLSCGSRKTVLRESTEQRS